MMTGETMNEQSTFSYYYPPMLPSQMPQQPIKQKWDAEKCCIRSWAIIFLGFGIFPLLFLAFSMTSSVSCVRVQPLLECHIDKVVSSFANDFSSIQIYWAISFFDQNKQQMENAWDLLNTSNLEIYSDFLDSYQQNSTYPCSIQDSSTNKMMLRDCNILAYMVLLGVALIWFVTLIWLILICIRKSQQKTIQQHMPFIPPFGISLTQPYE